MSDPETYFATYCRLDEASGDSCVVVNANAVTIAAELTVTKQIHVTKRGKEVPRILLSRGKEAMGFLPDKVFKQVDHLLEEGWICRAFASAVIFDKPNETYWVEVAIICYRPEDATIFDPFVITIARRMAKGDHPAIALSAKELEHVIESDGQWADVKSQQLPKLDKGMAYYKTKRMMTENLAYAAAEGNKGCYVGLFIVLFLIIFCIVSFFIFR